MSNYPDYLTPPFADDAEHCAKLESGIRAGRQEMTELADKAKAEFPRDVDGWQQDRAEYLEFDGFEPHEITSIMDATDEANFGESLVTAREIENGTVAVQIVAKHFNQPEPSDEQAREYFQALPDWNKAAVLQAVDSIQARLAMQSLLASLMGGGCDDEQGGDDDDGIGGLIGSILGG